MESLSGCCRLFHHSVVVHFSYLFSKYFIIDCSLKWRSFFGCFSDWFLVIKGTKLILFLSRWERLLQMLYHFSLFSRSFPLMRHHFHVSCQKIARGSFNCGVAFIEHLSGFDQEAFLWVESWFVEFPRVNREAVFVMTSSLQICFIRLVSSQVVFKSDSRVYSNLAVDWACKTPVVQCDVRISTSSIS